MMFFWFGTSLEDFLFKGFNITTWPGFLGVSVATSLLAFLLVLLTYYKEQIKNKHVHVQQPARLRTIREASVQPTQVGTSQKYHAICTILTLCQTTIGYFLMLIAMTFNAYLLIAIVIGSSIAYFSLNQHFVFHQSTNIPIPRPNVNLQASTEEQGSLMGNQEEISTITAAEVHE